MSVQEAPRTGFLLRIMATARGEVAADALEAYRRAGATVWRTLEDLEERHRGRHEAEQPPWAHDPGTRAERLCAWNAFCLQTLGDSLLDADYKRDPGTAGHVPAALAEHVLAFYAQVEAWVSRAYQARCNPQYTLDVSVPAGPLPWPAAGFDTATHMDALVDAAVRIQGQIDPLVALFRAEVPDEQRRVATRVLRLAGDASGKLEYARALWTPGDGGRVTREAARCGREAVDRLFLLGQVAAMPELADTPDEATPRKADSEGAPRPALPPRRATRTSRARPGLAPTDEWRLTDPALRASLRTLSAARKAIASLWRADPNPSQTLALQEEIEAAHARGTIAYATDGSGERVGCFYRCPWGPIYVALRPVVLGGATLRPMQQFTLELVPPDADSGTPFRRHLLVETFAPAKKLVYSARR